MTQSDKAWGCLGTIGLMLLLPLCFGGCWIGAGIQRSEGYRDGAVQKLSHKGLIWQTWEGEMAQAGFRLGGESTHNTWEFTVDNDSILAELQAIKPDEIVRLHYRQFLATLPWTGSTTCRITKIEKIAK